MVPCAILTADMVTTESGRSAGKTAQVDSEMTGPSAVSHPHMAEEQGMSFGTRISAREDTLKVAKRMVPCGTLNAERATVMLLAASALQTV